MSRLGGGGDVLVRVCGGAVVGALAQHSADLLLGGDDPCARRVGERHGWRRVVDVGGGAAAGLWC